MEMTKEDWHKVLHINLDGVFNCTKILLPGMIAQKSGRIINIASIAGVVVAYPFLTHYSASKAGIMGFTRSLALEVASQGVNVNAIAPGAIDVFEGQMDEAMTAQIIKTIPSGRMGKPLDVANLAVFLAGDESSYITGQCIVCDGGYTLP
jgi:3-oxoacyl-[acyl-carrier protein] reductase